MATIAVSPLYLRDVIMTIGADSYQAALSSAAFTPSASVSNWKGLTPGAVFTAGGITTWTVDLTYAQDWDSAGSLSAYLFNSEGSQVTATFKPRSGSGASFSATIIIQPGAVGGGVESFGEATVSLGVLGKPTLLAGTPVIPVVTLANPATGTIAGGSLIKITGSSFTGTTVVKFGTVNATSFTVESDSVIYAVTPAQAVGSKPVTVTNAVGVSTTTGAFSYV